MAEIPDANSLQLLAQFGAVAVLLLIVWMLPRLFASYQVARKEEREERTQERKADRNMMQNVLSAFQTELQRDRDAFSQRNQAVVQAVHEQTEALDEKLDSVTEAILTLPRRNPAA